MAWSDGSAGAPPSATVEVPGAAAPVLVQVGFLKFKADIVDEETKTKVPGIVFVRGPAVAVLILLESNRETYAVLTEQVRVPVGKILLELLAGTLDDEKGDFVGTIVCEVKAPSRRVISSISAGSRKNRQ